MFKTVENKNKDEFELLEFSEMIPSAEGLVIEKKSKFYSGIWQVKSEEDVDKIIRREKKKFPDARHYCYAYVIGKNKEKVRAADDGEPQGTAGKPILEVINSKELIDCMIIVTRIFGGVLLGTGGLTRAYSGAAKEALDNAKILALTPGKEIEICVDYGLSEKLKYFIEKNEFEIRDVKYSENVTFVVLVSDEKYEKFTEDVSNLTANKAEIEIIKELDIGVKDEEEDM